MTYCDCLDLIKDFEICPIAGKNEDGENVMIEHYDAGEPYFKITTFQKNGWARINYLYKGGSVEEIYEK